MSYTVQPHRCSPPGSPVPGILQARTLEWVAISFSNGWKWKVKVKSLRLIQLLATPWTAAYQAPPSMGFPRQECWSGVPLSSPPYLWLALFSPITVLQLCCLGSIFPFKAMVFPVVIYKCESWAINKAEHQRIDLFKLWCRRRLLRVLWTERRLNQSVLKEINPEYSLEGLTLKL